jgi:hypothetical protein
MNSELLKALNNIDNDLKNNIYLDKNTNSLTIHSLCNINEKLTITYSDKIKSYIINTNKETITLKKIDFKMITENAYISEGFEVYYDFDAIKCGFVFSNKKDFEFLICNKRMKSLTEEEYNQIKNDFFLDYSQIPFSVEKNWHQKVFAPFHFRKTKQIKKVLDAYIICSPCLKNKKKINYVKL